MKKSSSKKQSIFVFTISTLICLKAYGNPAPVDGGFFELYFVTIAVVCFTVEVIVTASLFKVFHDIDKSLFLIEMLYLLNLIAFFFVLFPLIKFTESIIVAEVGVLLTEMVGIRFCLALLGSDATWRRSFGYSLVSNTLSIIISLGLQW